jgi:hypothetical protein
MILFPLMPVTQAALQIPPAKYRWGLFLWCEPYWLASRVLDIQGVILYDESNSRVPFFPTTARLYP